MRGDELLNGMEWIDVELIEAADQYPEKTKMRKRYPVMLSLVAILAVLIIVFSFIWSTLNMRTSQDINLGGLISTTEGAMQGTTAQFEPTTEVTEDWIPDNFSYLTLDVNPSVQFAVEAGLIVDCIALNDDGERILSDLQLAGIPVEEALTLVLAEMIEQGYLAEEEHAPVMLLSARGSADSQALLHTAVLAAKKTLTEKNVETFIVTQEIDNTKAVERLAKLYGVSVGKMQYVLDILEEQAEISLEEASSRSIIELFGMDIEKRLIDPPYKVGDYDEYGEKVLFVGSVESYVGYIPWEELSDEYKHELSQMYTPEALAILSQPRVWTTMPNVVGLSADDALALLYSRNIAPLICYEDNPNARAAGFDDGACFKQDIPQGWRWNSDAAVHIWILVPESKAGDVH